MKDKIRGIYRKYKVEKLNDSTGKHKDCEYFVLDWKHDKFTIPAMAAYANACEKEYPLLAQDIRAIIDKYKGIKKAEHNQANPVNFVDNDKELLQNINDYLALHLQSDYWNSLSNNKKEYCFIEAKQDVCNYLEIDKIDQQRIFQICALAEQSIHVANDRLDFEISPKAKAFLDREKTCLPKTG